MQDTQVVGIDPGLVHTGLVSMTFQPALREIHLMDRVILGPDGPATQAAIPLSGLQPHKFIEGYRPRSNFQGDNRMVKAVDHIKVATHGTVLLNTGVKKVVRQPLMELLGVWRFATKTHHDDLRSAARIAIFGMLKDEQLNSLVAQVVSDHLEGNTWAVH
jgi:hypothetical protein